MTLHFNTSELSLQSISAYHPMGSDEGDAFFFAFIDRFKNRKCRLLLLDSVTRSHLSRYHLNREPLQVKCEKFLFFDVWCGVLRKYAKLARGDLISNLQTPFFICCLSLVCILNFI